MTQDGLTGSISGAMRSRILENLEAYEKSEGVAICLAVESGSRAWGFPSKDSDYDVRFLYLRRPEWYLSIDLEHRRDVIERPLTEDGIDLGGWDLRKALKLFRKSNPPLLEWLQCPLVYLEKHSVAARLRRLLPRFHSPRAEFFHYLNMARGNFREYLRGEEVWVKKYLYALRPLMAVRWIERGLGPVPIEFRRLVEATVDDPALKAAIDRLLADKAAGAELDRGPRVEAISTFVETEIGRLESSATAPKRGPDPLDELNELFRSALDEVWGRTGSRSE